MTQKRTQVWVKKKRRDNIQMNELFNELYQPVLSHNIPCGMPFARSYPFILKGSVPNTVRTAIMANLDAPQYTQTNCPARCKRSGKCYGRAWFDAKPGSSQPCIPKQCPWSDKFTKQINIRRKNEKQHT